MSISCLVENSAGTPAFVYWYKEGRVINYDQREGLIVNLGIDESTQIVSTLVIEVYLKVKIENKDMNKCT